MQTVMSVLCKFELLSSFLLLTKSFDHHRTSFYGVALDDGIPVRVAIQQPQSK